MNPHIPTDGASRGLNSLGQQVPSFPDNAVEAAADPAAFFDTAVSIYATAESTVTVVPEGNRDAVETLIAAYKLANDGEDPEDVTDLSGIDDLVFEIDMAAGAVLPFRVCMVTEIGTGSILAVY